jgi:hypothetical protein
MKEERESEVRKKMELATKSMIEKERYYETITVINRTPESKIFSKDKKIPGSQKIKILIDDL